MNKIYIVICAFIFTVSLGVTGCNPEPLTTKVMKTVTAPAQTITETEMTTEVPQAVTVTVLKTVTDIEIVTVTTSTSSVSATTSSVITPKTEITGDVVVDAKYEGTVQSHVGLNDYSVYSTANSIIVEAKITSFQRITINIFGEFYDSNENLLGTTAEMNVALPGMPGFGVVEIELITDDPSIVKKCVLVISEG